MPSNSHPKNWILKILGFAGLILGGMALIVYGRNSIQESGLMIILSLASFIVGLLSFSYIILYLRRRKTTVLLSFSQQDSDFAREFASALKGKGLRVIIPNDLLKPGDELFETISHYVRRADVVIPILSTSSSKSHWIDREARMALANGKNLLPIAIEEHISPLRTLSNLSHLQINADSPDKAADLVLNAMRDLQEPFSQVELNLSEDARLALVDEKLKNAVSRIASQLEGKNRELFLNAQRAWEEYRSAQAEFVAGPREESGTIWPLIYLGEQTHLTEARLEQLESDNDVE